MSPMKLSIVGPEDGFEEHVELDDELAAQLRQTIDAHPDLTMSDVIRQGVQHVLHQHGQAGHQH